MNFALFIDMAAAIAVTALLAESYGAVRRRLVSTKLAPVLLGTLFGIMAKVQMHHPLEPFDGMIVDLRNIPIALAGAFLGWRGLLPCILIAVLARLQLGGVGTAAGIWAMSFAGLAGIIWARKMAHYEKRTFGMLLLLALAMSTHLLGALALPRDMAVWFFTSAAGPILALNLVTIPLIGALLERENRRIAHEARLAAAATRDPDSGLLTGPAFVREVTNAFAAHPLGAFQGFVVISPQSAGWRGLFSRMESSGGVDVDPHVFSRTLTHWSLAGLSADGRILIPITENEVELSHRIRASVREAMSQAQSTKAKQQLWDVSVIATLDPGTFLRLVENAALSVQPQWSLRSQPKEYSTLRPGEPSMVRRSALFNPAEHDALFAKASFLMDRGRD